MKMYQTALKFIAEKHKGQKRNNGNPYIIHPIRVSQEVSGDLAKTCALLHDVIEDTDTTLEEIRNLFGYDVALTVELLTHRKGESYDVYINRVKTSTVATQVKIADICDNLSDSPSSHAIEKSAKALEILVN
jgi:(p)ppGpp synthase/HD superfamily hydrolase